MIDDEEKGLTTYDGAYMISFEPNNTKIIFSRLMIHIQKLILEWDLEMLLNEFIFLNFNHFSNKKNCFNFLLLYRKMYSLNTISIKIRR